MTTPTRWMTMLGLVCCMAAGGCGYTCGELYRDDVQTVAVDMFTRGEYVYRRELETRVTEALIKRINLTPYRIAPKNQADTLLTGSVDMVSQSVLHYNPDTGRPREMEMVLRVSFTWKDQRTGREIEKHRNVLVAGTYIPHEPISEDFFEGSEDVANRAAERIVEYMERDF
ncbi:MAG: LPS assembly lipoprotein LptE [Phycisphaerae bacterium]